MEKTVQVETKSPGMSWLPMLAIVTVMFTAGLVTVAIVAYLDLQELDQSDAILRREIEILRTKLETTRNLEAFPVDKSEQGSIQTEESGPSIRGKRMLAPTNIFDAILQAQEAIFEKYCHKPNSTCPNGVHGDKGPQGDTGSPGIAGILGKLGPKGESGDPGLPGLKGETGDTGPTGRTGATGPRGPSGLLGSKGDPGPVGAVGSIGTAGSKGSKGPKGDMGGRGPAGPTGQSGLKGEKGDRGERGFNGSIGNEGPPGTKGKDVKTLGDGCECMRQPTFSDTTYTSGTHARSTIDVHCKATGNPEPEISIRKITDTKHSGETYECVATNMFGSASKYVQIRSNI